MATVREQPALSTHGLVEFMTGNFLVREDILRRYKYQYPGQKVYAPYYQSAISAIRQYHRLGNDAAVFGAQTTALEDRLRGESNPRIQVRLRENIRAITSYEKHFGRRRFAIPPQVRVPPLGITAVTITCNPDLQVIEADNKLLITLHCAVTKPEKEAVAILSQLIHAAYQKVEAIPAGNVRFLVVQSGEEESWTGRVKRRWPHIEAACRQIRALWPHV